MVARVDGLSCPPLAAEAHVELVDDRHTWNAWVTEQTRGNILQSFEWGEFKSHFGWRPVRLLLREGGRTLGGAQVLLRRLPLGCIAYVPRGPVVDFTDPEAMPRLFAALHYVARQVGAIFLKIEPEASNSAALAARLSGFGFRRASEVQPRSTLIADLRPDPDALLARLNTKTRYNIGLAKRKGVLVAEGTAADVPVFYRLLKETSQRAGFPIHSLDYYVGLWRGLANHRMARLLVARYQDEPVATAMTLVAGERAYYMYGASSSDHRNVKPNDLLQWECLNRAKSEGCTSYDLWGIPDEVGRAAEAGQLADDGDGQGLWGVYNFKRGFGGQIVRYAGGFDYVYSPARYWLWLSLIPRIRRIAARRSSAESRYSAAA